MRVAKRNKKAERERRREKITLTLTNRLNGSS